jgi:fructokinase
MVQLGVDFGGSKIEAAALGSDGQVVARLRVPNPGDYDAALLAVRDLVAGIEAEVGHVPSFGIGTPGSVSPLTGTMRNSNSLYLNGRRFQDDLEQVLQRPLSLANDANCFALSEAIDGAGEGAQVVFGMIIGTGCGGGVVVDRKIVAGGFGNTGEIGHIPLPWARNDEVPPPCWCGQSGCVERWVSGSGFERAFTATTGRTLPAPAIVAAARSGDPEARAALASYIDRLGRSIAVIVNLLDPGIVVLGGGMSNVAEIYEAAPAIVERYAFADGWKGKVLPARWGDSSGVRGAARLVDV